MSDSCDPMECNLSGSTVHGISQARALDWVAISFSRGSFQPKNRTLISCIVAGLLCHRQTLPTDLLREALVLHRTYKYFLSFHRLPFNLLIVSFDKHILKYWYIPICLFLLNKISHQCWKWFFLIWHQKQKQQKWKETRGTIQTKKQKIFTARETIKQCKINLEKCLQICFLIWVYYPKYISTSCNSIAKTQTIRLKTGQWNWTDTFPKNTNGQQEYENVL